MSKELKIKLIRTFPKIFYRDLKKLTNEYTEREYYSWSLLEDEKKEKKLPFTLEEVIGQTFTKELGDLLRDKFYCHLRLDENTPPELRNNPEFCEWIAYNNPVGIIYIPEHLMKFEYVKLYEDFILANPSYYLIYELSKVEVPRLITGSEKLINRIIEEFTKDPSYLSIYLLKILNNYVKNPSAVNKIIDSLKDYTSDFARIYDKLNPALQASEKIVKIVLDYDINYYSVIINEKKQFAKEYIITGIKTGKVDLEKAVNQIYNNNPNIKVTYDSDFISVIVDKYFENYSNNKDLWDTIERIVHSLKFDLSNLTIEGKYRLFKLFPPKKISLTIERNLFLDDEEFFLYLINLKDFELIHNFENEIVEKHFSTIFKAYKENPEKIKLIPFIEKLKESEVVVDLFLTESLENEKFFKKYIAWLKKYDIDTFQKEKFFPNVIELLKKDYDETELNDIITSLYRSNTDFLNSIIDNNLLKYITLFSSEAYNTDVLKKLMKIYSLIDLQKHLNIQHLEQNLDIDNEEDLSKVIELNRDSDDIMSILLIVQIAKRHNLNVPGLDDLFAKINEFKKGKTDEYQLVIDKIINGERNVSNVKVVGSEKSVKYVVRIGNISDTNIREFIDCIPEEILYNINPKHVREIQRLLSLLPNTDQRVAIIGLNIYCALGFERAKELLLGAYGTVKYNKICNMFNDISLTDVMFKKVGKNYVPIINEKLVNLVFGANKNVQNTPIRNYLSDNADKSAEIAKKMKEIREGDLEKSVKDEIIQKLKAELHDYEENNKKFMSSLSQVFNEWDIYEEEFLKMAAKEKLKIKLNAKQINKITEILKSKRNATKLESRDQELMDSDVFEYVGRDTQYTLNVETVVPRTIELSRGMDKITTKKFPNVEVSKGGLKAAVFNPQDRNILSAGYKSHCCFRPNGHADNGGKNNSLLYYCTNTNYGGGVSVTNEKGEILMFSPILRNGNVLMIHSFESNGLQGRKEEINELLIQFAEEIIRKAQEMGDDIAFVTMTNLHSQNMCFDLIKSSLPDDKRFRVYDEDKSLEGMYTNLDSTSHMILASREGATFDDIHYGPVSKDYEYKTEHKFFTLDLNPDILSELKKLELIKDKIIILTNKKELARTNKNYEEAYTIQKEIKAIKQDYLKLYKKIIALANGKDIFEDYRRNMSIIEEVCKTNNTMIPNNIKRCICGKGWYIIVTEDGKLIGDSLEYSKEVYQRMFSNEVQYNPNLIPFANGLPISDDEVITNTNDF